VPDKKVKKVPGKMFKKIGKIMERLEKIFELKFGI